MPRIFISYKRADKDIVFPLKDKIEAAIGEPCWIDLEGIDCELKEWEDVVIKAINEASVFIFVYSKTLSEVVDFEDDRTFDEFAYAREKKKRIVFVNIDATPLTDRFAFRFGARQQVDGTSEGAINRLIKDIRKWLDCKETKIEEKKKDPFIVTKPIPSRYVDLGVNRQEDNDKKQENDQSITTQAVEGFTTDVLSALGTLSSGIPDAFNISSGLKYRYDKSNLTAEVIGIENEHLKALVIPSYVYHRSKKYTIIGIKEKAFENKLSFTLVKLPKTITFIGSGAFRKCENLSSINIPENVETIGYEAFEGCTNIVSVNLPSKIDTIEHSVFKGCVNLTDMILPNGIKEIGSSAFEGCSNLHTIDFPSNIKSIKASAFARCVRLKSITIPNSVTEIGSSAFEECGELTDITLSCNIIEIRESVFQNCSNLRSIIIPSSVINVLRFAFLKCEKLEEVIMSNRIQRIGQSAFYGCNNLKRVVLPLNTFFEHGTFPQTCEIIRR